MSQPTPEKKPAPSFSLTVNKEPKEIFMSFALLNRLTYLVGSPEQVGLLLLDAEIRELAAKELLADRTNTGNMKEVPDLFALDVDMQQMQDLLDWAAEHVLVFTLGVAERSTKQQLKHQERLLNLTSTVTGLASSLSKTSAA